MTLRIALNEVGGAQWTGGITYRANLVKALAMCPEAASVFLLASEPESAPAGLPVIRHTGATGWALRANEAAKRVLKVDRSLARTLRGRDIDVVFPASTPPTRATATVYWIPDFQYIHLPQLYTPAQLRAMTPKLAGYFEAARLVVVSSADAQADLVAHFPKYGPKARVLRFVAHVPADLYQRDAAAVAQAYHLPPDFFYLPNQFWAHKNHEVVLEALRIARDRGVRPFVVCTGNPVDVRDPSYFARILARISTLGIRDQIALLGMVPHEDVYALMRQSKAVLNPSLFEGWSTSVEEAKSVGKRVLLSDLPVHREQDPAGGEYFARHDAADLADRMIELWHAVPAGPDAPLEEAARAALPGRMKEFGLRFIDICREAAGAR